MQSIEIEVIWYHIVEFLRIYCESLANETSHKRFNRDGEMAYPHMCFNLQSEVNDLFVLWIVALKWFRTSINQQPSACPHVE